MKKKTIILIVNIILLIGITIGISYSFYNAKIKVINQTSTVIQTATYKLIYTGLNEITADKILPGDSFEKTFSIENTSKYDVVYNIHMENVYNEFNDDLVYTILDGDTVVVNETPLPKTSNEKVYIMKNKTIGPKEKKNFKMKVEFKYYPDVDQNINANARFDGTVGIDTDKLEHKIIFDSTGGKSTVAEKDVIEGEQYGELPKAVKEGYTFNGWYTSAIDGDKIDENTIYNTKDVQTLYAHWTANTYKLTFNANGGEVNIEKKDVTYDSTYDELPVPSFRGYKFIGWYLDSELKNLISKDSIVKIISDTTVYAKWDASNYKVSLDANGGIVSTDSIEVKYNDKYKLLPIPTREGYTFDGWYDGEKQITNESIVEKVENHTLLAHWINNEYNVTFNLDGGTLETDNKKVTYDKNYGTLPIPTKEGYTFDGWYTSKENGKKIEEATTVKIAKNHTLYAIYKANSYTVTFNATGGNVDLKSLVVTYDNEYGTLPVPTYDGYDFVGWFTKEINGIQITENAKVTIVNDQTLYAVWTARFDTPYKVLHWQQNINGDANSHDNNNYTLIDSQVFSGTTNEKVSPDVNNYTGFTSPNVEQLKIKNDGSSILNYYYTRNNYKLTINKSSGVDDITGSGIYAYDSNVKIGYTILKGYTFTGITGDVTTNSFKMPANDITLKINAKANTYKVTFDASGGEVDTKYKDVIYGSTYKELPTPTKEGYTFIGWYTNLDNEVKINEDTKVEITENQTLYAHYKANTYNVTFDANGGNDVSTVLSVTYDSTYNELPIPTREGYTFDGWYTNKNNGEIITSSSVYKLLDNQILYAHWTAKSYTITFDANGGTADLESTKVIYDDTYNKLPSASKEGYTFIGWFTEKNAGIQILETTKVKITKNQTLYAHYSNNTYTVEFNANKGTLNEKNKKVVYDEEYKTLPIPTREGYTFIGWFTKEDGGIQILETTKVKITETQTLYAQWRVNTYTVDFNTNGGDEITTTSTVTYGSTYGILPIPTKEGYTFDGWYTDIVNGTEITNSSKVEILESQTLYAHWIANQYEVIVNANNGLISDINNWVVSKDKTTATKKVTYDDIYGNLPTPTREGYTFVGWYTKSIEGVQITDTSKVKIIEAQTLYAHWEANKYNLTIDANSGLISETTGWTVSQDKMTATKKITYNGTYNSLPIPSKEGYDFVGWFTKNDGGVQIFDTTKVTVTEDQTLYALWKAKKVTVTFNANGGTVDKNSMQVTYDDSYNELPSANKTGYTFDGWYTALNGGIKILNTSVVNLAENHTLYAHYVPNTYKVTFNTNGGTNTLEYITVTYDDVYKELPTPTKEGYTFNGWYTKESNGIQILNTTKVTITEDQKLYAYWVANTDTPYKVLHWQQNIGSSSESHDDKNYTLINTENLTGTTNENVKPAVKKYSGFTEPTSISTVIKADGSTVVNYYYTRNSYKLTVNKSTGVASITGTGTYQYEENVKIGYSISTGYTYSSITGDMTTNSFKMPDKDITLKVNATANKYNLTINAIDGIIPEITGWTVAQDKLTATKKITYDKTYENLPTPVKEGYTFDGWYTKTIDGSKIENSTTVKVTEDQTLYAHYKANSYTVLFDANGGNDVSSILTVTYDGTYGDLPTPTKEGYTFTGWYTSKTNDKEITSESIVKITSSQTLYAHWKIKTYEVKINSTNSSVDTNSINIEYGGTSKVTVIPNDGYYLANVTCTNGYTSNATTGINMYDKQTITISNNQKDSLSVCTISASRINSKSITYSNPATEKTNIQDAIDELYTKFR